MAILMTSVVLALSASALPVSDGKSEVYFNAHIRPILKANCFACHGEEAKPKGELDLRLARFAIQGGATGPAIVPGKPDESLLIKRLHDDEMPPGKKKLNKADKDLIARWIAGGAKTETAEPEKLSAGLHIAEVDRQYWFFQPIVKPVVPRVPGKAGIDAFVEAKLKANGLSLSATADKRTLLRRVTFDLTGLPPTSEELEQFLADAQPDAFERVVDRLLASPRYGERWARHWLDVAGYADSEGGSPADPVRANAWMYRDYLIRSFNADKPFDRMIVEQLAGDELVPTPHGKLTAEQQDWLVATGFLRTAADGTGAAGVDQKLARNQVLTDTVKIVSSSFLGLTVGCAECHNHRYDPIPQSDFYRLRAIFEPAYDTTNWKPPAARQVSLTTPEERKKSAEVEARAVKIDADRLKKQQEFIDATLEKEYAKLPDELRGDARKAREAADAKRTAEQKKILREHPSLNISAGSLYLYDSKAAAELAKMTSEATALRATKPVEVSIRALFEVAGKIPVTRLLHRGDPDQPKETVEPGGLALLEASLPFKIAKPASGSTGRRLALANWLIDARNPLTARVLVNRVWMQHFGKGIVGSPGDFGRLGEAPSHPELLDWLASEFTGHGWSLKRLHRTIVLSETYRQSSQASETARTKDSANRYLSRFPLRRLDAESIRDSMLAISGTLNDAMYGPPVPVRENEVGAFVLGNDNKDTAGRFTAEKPLAAGAESRRSVYVQVRRTRPLAELDVFDWATAEPNCELRKSSTVTPQALMLLNNETMAKHAQQFAKRLLKDAKTPELQVKRAWQLVYLGEPTTEESFRAVEFLKEARQAMDAKSKDPASPEERALAVFCQALFASNRYLYLD